MNATVAYALSEAYEIDVSQNRRNDSLPDAESLSPVLVPNLELDGASPRKAVPGWHRPAPFY